MDDLRSRTALSRQWAYLIDFVDSSFRLGVLVNLGYGEHIDTLECCSIGLLRLDHEIGRLNKPYPEVNRVVVSNFRDSILYKRYTNRDDAHPRKGRFDTPRLGEAMLR